MKFTPFKFQVPLAAGGIALMAFNYLQFAVPHGNGLITLADIARAELSQQQSGMHFLLIVIMLAFSLVNLLYTPVYLTQLLQWFANKTEYSEFMAGPPTKNIGIFVPIASLSMTANVILAPMAFFIPQISSNIQATMIPGLVFFGLLCLVLFRFEFRLIKSWLSKPIDSSQLSFVWLIDVFAFGLVCLTGTGVAVLSSSKEIASIAALASFFTLVFGFFLLVFKLAYLLYLQVKASKLPGTPVLPAFFILIPITCLYGFSFYRILIYLQTYFAFDTKLLSFVFLTLSYLCSIGWGCFCLYLLSGYFKNDFLKSDFSPTQWALV